MTKIDHFESLRKLLKSEFDLEPKNAQHYEIALTHKSFGNETRVGLPLQERDNERMEFLGDAVLEMHISVLLLERFPDEAEGQLSKRRASLVNEKALSAVAEELKLGELLRLGKGEDQTLGRTKPSILSSALEAIVAAVFLDLGYKNSHQFVSQLFSEKLDSLTETYKDSKTILQEKLQALARTTPSYHTVRSFGPDHDKRFEVAIQVFKRTVLSAEGRSKKDAEQKAAEKLLALIESGGFNPGKIK